MSYRPWYNENVDYQTNAKSYMDYLGRVNKFMQVLLEDYEVFQEVVIEELERIKFNAEMEVEDILLNWLEDGTLERIINDEVFGNKADTEWVENQLNQLREDIQNDLNDTIDNVNTSLSDMDTKLTNEIDNLKTNLSLASQYGFVGDYVGNPSYDGNDNNRVTATDNTQALEDLLDDAIEKKNLTVYFPKGHYGFKQGNITKDLTGVNLTLIGEGQDSTIFDYIKEGSNQSGDDDTVIATLDKFEKVAIKDMTIKGTNNLLISGSYNGRVSGFEMTNFKHLHLNRLRVSHFNRHGFRVNSDHTSLEDSNELVEIIDCIGHENRVSGFSIAGTKKLYVDGGEYYLNGGRDDRGTGYGITASRYVGSVTVKNANFHHSYRRGFDTHGSLDVEIINCRFDTSFYEHVGIRGWGQYDQENNILIKDTIFSQSDVQWLNDYARRQQSNGLHSNRANVIGIHDSNESGVALNTLDSVTLDNITVLNAHNVSEFNEGDTSSGITINAEKAKVSILNSNINLKDWKTKRTAGARNAFPIKIEVSEFLLSNSTVRWLEDSTNTVDGSGNGSIFFIEHGMEDNEYRFINSFIYTKNSFIMGRPDENIGSSNPNINTDTIMNMINTTIEFKEVPINKATADRRYTGSFNSPSSYKGILVHNTTLINNNIPMQLINNNQNLIS